MGWKPNHEAKYMVGSVVYNTAPLATKSGLYPVDSKLEILAHSNDKGYTVRSANGDYEPVADVCNDQLVSAEERNEYVFSLPSKSKERNTFRLFEGCLLLTTSVSCLLLIACAFGLSPLPQCLATPSATIFGVCVILCICVLELDEYSHYSEDLAAWCEHEGKLAEMECILTYKARKYFAVNLTRVTNGRQIGGKNGLHTEKQKKPNAPL